MDKINVTPQVKDDACVAHVVKHLPTPQEQDKLLSTTSQKDKTKRKDLVPRLNLGNVSSAEQGTKEDDQATGATEEHSAASCQSQDEEDSDTKRRKEPHYY